MTAVRPGASLVSETLPPLVRLTLDHCPRSVAGALIPPQCSRPVPPGPSRSRPSINGHLDPLSTVATGWAARGFPACPPPTRRGSPRRARPTPARCVHRAARRRIVTEAERYAAPDIPPLRDARGALAPTSAGRARSRSARGWCRLVGSVRGGSPERRWRSPALRRPGRPGPRGRPRAAGAVHAAAPAAVTSTWLVTAERRQPRASTWPRATGDDDGARRRGRRTGPHAARPLTARAHQRARRMVGGRS